MVTSLPDVARVARVVGELPGSRFRLGSGYRISDHLVLTAAHVLDDAADLAADLGGDGDYRPVTPVWRDTGADLALLRFAAAPTARVDPVRIGGVDRARISTVGAHAAGYPVYAEIGTPDGGRRGRAAVRCSVRTADTGAPGDLRVGIEDAAPASAPPGASPWQGMSGAAVITTDGLLVAVFREHLTPTGVAMHQVTALDRVDDEEWRALLTAEGVDPRPRPALPDGWDRTGGRLQRHHLRLDAIRRMRHPLVEEKVHFVDPGDDSSPGNVLARLTELASGPGLPSGVVLTGDAGAGKTRLCLETAARADREGWLVVHLTGKASLTDVGDSVGPRAGRVLVVADDIDWINDAGQIHGRVRDAVAASGTRAAFLTTARSVRLKDLESEPLRPQDTFVRIRVRSDPGYHSAICRELVRGLAPNAVGQQGEERVELMCEGPPAFSQLFASVYDNQAREGNDITAVVPRPDADFRVWLHGVLAEVGLPAVPWDGDADPATTAVARIVAHAPCALKDALDCFAPDSDDPADPRRVAGAGTIQRLVRNGLLSVQADSLRPVHDLYGDVLLGHGVVEAGGERVHRAGLRRVLESGLADGTALARVAASVDRLRATLGDEAGGRLAAEVEEWCTARLDTLRELVVEEPRSEGRELEVLLTRPTWRPVAARELAGPWLARHHGRTRARDAVLTAARHLPPEVSRPYLMAWLRRNAVHPAAAFAFHHVLRAEDIAPGPLEWTTDLAYEWLTLHAPRHSAARPLCELLDPRKKALSRDDPRLGQVLRWGLNWLDEYGTTSEASFVARTLLMRPELTGTGLVRTARLLLDTVAPANPADASFALEAVLGRCRQQRDLPKEVFEQAVKDSLLWLEDGGGHGRRPAAAYVLRQLVTPDLPGRDTLARAVQAAWNWLEPNADRHLELGMVLPPLLKNVRKADGHRNAAFTDEEQLQLQRLAVRWLSSSGSSSWRGVSEVAGALLRTSHPDQDPEVLDRLTRQALDLVEKHPYPTVARSVLPPLLHKNLDPGTRDRLMAAAFAQLPPAPTSPHTAFLLSSLLSRADLGADEHDRAMAATLEWLDRYPRGQGAVGLLNSALGGRRTSPDDRGRLAARAVQVLSPLTLLPPGKKRPWLVETLRLHRHGIRPEWNRLVSRACDLLDRRAAHTAPLLGELLKGADLLDAPVLERLHLACADWCALYDRSGWVPDLLSPVLGSRDASPAVRRRVSQVARDRLRPGSERNDALGKLLEALLRDGDLSDPEHADAAVDFALGWLEEHAGPAHRRKAHAVLLLVGHWLARAPQRPRAQERIRRAKDRMDAHLRDYPDEPSDRRRALEHHRRILAGPSGPEEAH
ncbi:S1 family peptidase [Streptomyces cadmiisoli]|uniref:Serine protease n=1 Tax=Streptomyces cadmiisoli TaxID=2184053 RepID=A0A2Z4J7G7_9ACTN|nr:serine protease [Streptomyces cadmiisoli]AWW40333.1 hypothetical protein DN051_29710 [Streptomyces cadmiisoli]